MKRLYVVIAVCILVIPLVFGCSTGKGFTQTRDHLLSNGENGNHYISLHESSLSTYENLMRLRFLSHTRFVRHLKDRFGTTPGLTEFADNFLHEEEMLWKDTHDLLTGLRSEAASGGVLCEFEQIVDGEKVAGFLIIRDGKVLRRVVWAEGY